MAWTIASVGGVCEYVPMTTTTLHCETCETETPHYRSSNGGWTRDEWVCENMDGAPMHSEDGYPAYPHATIECED